MYIIFVAFSSDACIDGKVWVSGAVGEVGRCRWVGPREVPKDRGCWEDNFTVWDEGPLIFGFKAAGGTIAARVAAEELTCRVMTSSHGFTSKFDAGEGMPLMFGHVIFAQGTDGVGDTRKRV